MTSRPSLARVPDVAMAFLKPDSDAAIPATYPVIPPSSMPPSSHSKNPATSAVMSFANGGCGFGIAACMASLLGFESYGIEIEPEIAEFADQLAKDHNLPVEILNTSYLPEGYEECEGIGGKDLLPPEATSSGGVPIDTTPIYDGLDPGEVDLFFVYPWPGQEGLMMDLFKALATEDAILLIAHGEREITAYRRGVDDDD